MSKKKKQYDDDEIHVKICRDCKRPVYREKEPSIVEEFLDDVDRATLGILKVSPFRHDHSDDDD